MTDPLARDAGVLELLRHFKTDAAAADSYAATQLAFAKSIEPTLKAFEVLPVDVTRKSGPLSGIPVAIKDIIATADMVTTNGSPVYKDHVPAADAWVVARLRALGATIFGKTVSTEFAWRHPGATTNPWNAKHSPGGSSSGSAAAVAAGIVPLALGSQTLGSVIRPAAFNGVVGFKPSYGAIPRSGVHPLSGSLDHVGFFARRVDDVALALSLLAASDDSDRHGQGVPAFEVPIDHGLASQAAPRLAVVRFAKYDRVETAQKLVLDAAIDKLRAAGAMVDELELPDLDAANWDAINTILTAEGGVQFERLVADYPDRTSAKLKELVQLGGAHSATAYLRARALQARLQAAFADDIKGFDAVLTLPAFGEAPEGLHYTGDAEYCAPWTLLGVPALSLPAGFGANGLPLGLQLVGAYRQDFHVLRVAKWVEAGLAWSSLSPLLAGRGLG